MSWPQVLDNMTRPAFGLMARRATENNIPVYVFEAGQMEQGAVLAVASDYYQAAIEASEKAYRVLTGESPALIPFSNVQAVSLIINPAIAEHYGITIPDALYRRAEKYTGQIP